MNGIIEGGKATVINVDGGFVDESSWSDGAEALHGKVPPFF